MAGSLFVYGRVLFLERADVVESRIIGATGGQSRAHLIVRAELYRRKVSCGAEARVVQLLSH